ncbi:2-dehydropantoate 2-reductase [Herbaspirillum sp. alder98]|uniref:2-dehydropantoate 2-reductase n=1 Tax=Herbaspirillum sp. alder98 TaxID=2913096 RepID=UPI001CD847A5|nr:2-dehydropantoate 2-reductase [Herbaspirillum sp. alder98]MCA1326519.1 2-dehydropantoate 2-reductase [Herbaspirillum sp. alder98]
MKILIVGAGAVGGYFGARLHAAGRDVSFLVRPRRAALLREHGLRVRSPSGELDLTDVKLVDSAGLQAQYDLVILSSKAYDLDDAVASMAAAAVGPGTAILPLLNGMQHLDVLARRFGSEAVLGGQCVIASTLDADGVIRHLNSYAGLTFGELAGGSSERTRRLEQALTVEGFELRQSDDILQAMWEKWTMLATLASATSLMRASIGDILQGPGGLAFIEGVLAECAGVAELEGHRPGESFYHRTRGMLTEHGSTLTASMFRDIGNGNRIEADHIVGDLIRRGEAKGAKTTLLQLAYLHLKAYEAQRERVDQAPH